MTDLEKAVLDRYRDFRIAFEELCLSRYANKDLASTLEAGLMSPADKIKLDALDNIIADLRTSISGGDSSARADIVTLQSAVTSLQTQVAGIHEYTLPVASTSQLGGVKVGNGLGIDDGTLNVTLAGGDSIAQAAITNLQTQIGGMQTSIGNVQTSLGNVQTSLGNVQTSLGNVQTSIGNVQTSIGNVQTSIGNVQTSLGDLRDDFDGYEVPIASASTAGVIIVGAGLSMAGDTLNLQAASESAIGGIIVGNGLVMRGDTLSVDHNIFAAVVSRFTLATTAWLEDPDPATDFTRYADINIAGLSSTYLATVDFDLVSENVALDAGVARCAQTLDGKIRLFAENVPSDALTGQVTFRRG